jgi:hypothetical protein
MSEVHRGGCLCGHVRYRTLGKPERTTICHCTFCQRLTGSAFLVEPVFLTTNVESETGTVSTYDYCSPDHGRMLRINFCPKCGTHLSLLFERFPTMQGICGGTFDDPNWFKPDRHIFTRSAVPWMTYPHDVSCFESHAIGIDGSPQTPWQADSRLRDTVGQ